LAGHPIPIVRRGSGAAEPLRGYGHFGLIGINGGLDAAEIPWVRFPPGSLLVLPTDGVLDAGIGRGEQFGMGRLLDAIESADDPCDVIEVVWREIFRHMDGHPLEDDSMLLVIARSPRPSPSLVQELRSAGTGYGQGRVGVLSVSPDS
jgi:serine phosphatase RsbU (regulator of sigma subunit)